MDYLNAFLCGGILCAIGQILIDKTPLTPARILTGYVVCGVLLTAIGVYEPIVRWGGSPPAAVSLEYSSLRPEHSPDRYCHHGYAFSISP